MTATDSTIDRVAIRRTVRTLINDRPVDKRQVIVETATQLDYSEAAVRDELNELEREGFVYTVGDGDGAEVKLP